MHVEHMEDCEPEMVIMRVLSKEERGLFLRLIADVFGMGEENVLATAL